MLARRELQDLPELEGSIGSGPQPAVQPLKFASTVLVQGVGCCEHLLLDGSQPPVLTEPVAGWFVHYRIHK